MRSPAAVDNTKTTQPELVFQNPNDNGDQLAGLDEDYDMWS